MVTVGKIGCVAVLTAIGICTALAQKPSSGRVGSKAASEATGLDISRSQSLADDDRLSLLAAALDARVRNTETDCSHLVHAIYEEAGFSYSYAPSSDLYAGVDGFQRVKKPEPGDLVVWRGHVGIVIKPSQHVFFSVLSTGPGIDDYTTSYWKHRGKPRFYRYLKSSFAAHPSPQLMRTNRIRKSTAPSDTDEDK